MMCAFLVGTTTACTNGSEQNKEETQKDKSDKASKKDKKDKKEVSPAVAHYIVACGLICIISLIVMESNGIHIFF